MSRWRYTDAINLARGPKTQPPCCDRIGKRTTYYSRGRRMVLCGHCLEAVLHSENHWTRAAGPEELSRLASYYNPA